MASSRAGRVPSTYVAELYRNNGWTISHAHHGLAAFSLEAFAPFLTMEEIAAFAPAAWRLTNDPESKNTTILERGEFSSAVRQGVLYDVFRLAHKKGFPLINHHMPPRFEQLDATLNPHYTTPLEQRLLQAGTSATEQLFAALESKPVFVFPCDDEKAAHEYRDELERVHVMHFQTVYPRRGTVTKKFVSEIGRILSAYPAAQTNFEHAAVAQLPPVHRRGQYALF